jgi:hypothetical protein
MRLILGMGFAALICLASPAAFADPPNGSFVEKDNTTYDQKNPQAKYSSRIIQNGQFISGNCGCWDQTTYPGSRADHVQNDLGDRSWSNGNH